MPSQIVPFQFYDCTPLMKFISKKTAELADAILFFSAIRVGNTFPTSTLRQYPVPSTTG